MDKAYLGSAAVAAALVLGGCVTQGSYEKLEAEKAQEIDALQSQRAALTDPRGQLFRSELARLGYTGDTTGAATAYWIDPDRRGILPLDSSGTLEITGIEVDVAGKDAATARYNGWRIAQRQGFKALWAKTHNRPIGQAPNLSDSALDNLVSSIIVQREQIGPNRYIAELGILFDRARSAELLSKKFVSQAAHDTVVARHAKAFRRVERRHGGGTVGGCLGVSKCGRKTRSASLSSARRAAATPPSQDSIRCGIEFDAIGRRVAYHFRRRHPGDSTDQGAVIPETARVPAATSDLAHPCALDDHGDRVEQITEIAGKEVFDRVGGHGGRILAGAPRVPPSGA